MVLGLGWALAPTHRHRGKERGLWAPASGGRAARAEAGLRGRKPSLQRLWEAGEPGPLLPSPQKEPACPHLRTLRLQKWENGFLS